MSVEPSEEEESALVEINEQAVFDAFDKFKENWPTMKKVFENFPQIFCEPKN